MDMVIEMENDVKKKIKKYFASAIGIGVVFLLVRFSGWIGRMVAEGMKIKGAQIFAWSVGELAVLALLIVLIYLTRGLSLKDMVSVKDKSWYWRGALSGLMLFVCMFLGSVVLTFFINELKPQTVVTVISQANEKGLMIGALLFGAVLAPFTEEMMCRGYLFGVLRNHLGEKQAIFLTALIFAFLHFDLYRFILLFGAGIWLNLVYIHSQSVVISAITHGMFNGCMLLLVLLA